MLSIRISLLFILFPTFCSTFLVGQEFDERFSDWPVDLKINGTIVLLNRIPEKEIDRALFEKMFKTAGLLRRDQNASGQKEKNDSKESKSKKQNQPKKKESPKPIAVWLFHTLPNEEFAQRCTPENFEPQVFSFQNSDAKLISQSLRLAKVVVLTGHDKSDLLNLNMWKDDFENLIERKGLLIAQDRFAKALSTIIVSGESNYGAIKPGMGLIPDSVIETRFESLTDEKRLNAVMASSPGLVGLGLKPKSVFVLRGRKCFLMDHGNATLMLAANQRKPVKVKQLTATVRDRRDITKNLADWTQWRRDAMDRTLEPFPADKPGKPLVEKGRLVIVGGGGMPEGLMKQFVEFAGGPEKARLIYVPCSESETVPGNQYILNVWKKMGVRHVSMLHTKDRQLANTDEDLLKPLRKATGIWFGGGRQWNFADSYYGTTAHRLMKEVLHRGGVVGGSSAGASIQARFLARATPIGNMRIMAPGYERGGLGFISGVAIDQHFSQRGRQKDMTALMAKYPQLLGIGIDETTAIIVSKSEAKVVGKGRVHFYDRNQPVFPDRPDYIALKAGEAYDLAARKIIRQDKPKTPEIKGSKENKKAVEDADTPAEKQK